MEKKKKIFLAGKEVKEDIRIVYYPTFKVIKK
jgi:hypothetical protein